MPLYIPKLTGYTLELVLSDVLHRDAARRPLHSGPNVREASSYFEQFARSVLP
ncbi:hypothetical protein DEA8626_03455 [Defluviimonas aquaemixtae]|uniref:Uncharacterized protein n=1 Tax=Albidovulum aquaemixtae TaxID=1542388 RepID=A0A2R8BM26_9RHOB|nr:hypothetical protein [Defluviimonas aquaemixtae]SPH24403.1 hypothetical protein DEA8626_03455 [Defluviimonas aquaemixtae]